VGPRADEIGMVKASPSVVAGSAGAKLEYSSKFNSLNTLGNDFRALLAGQPGGPARCGARSVEFAPGAGPPGDLAPAVPGLHPLRRLGAGGAEALDEALDPLTRSLAGSFIGVPPASAAAVAPPPPLAAAAGSAALDFTALEEAVRRVAWGGDRRRGVARIELGGEHAGTAVVVHGEGRSVGLSVQGAAGTAAGELAERLLERLRARGLDVTHEGWR